MNDIMEKLAPLIQQLNPRPSRATVAFVRTVLSYELYENNFQFKNKYDEALIQSIHADGARHDAH